MVSVNFAPIVPATSNRVFGKRTRFQTLLLFFIVVGWLLGPSVVRVRAQSVDYLQALGLPPFSTQLPVEQGYISAANGNLHLEIPMGSFPQRGGKQLTMGFTYDSSIWDGTCCAWLPQNVPFTGQWNVDAFDGGWQVKISPESQGATYNMRDGLFCSSAGMAEWTNFEGWTWTGPDGTTHAFHIATVQGNYTGPPGYGCGDFRSHTVCCGDALAMDGSGYHMYVSNVTNAYVYAPDGSAAWDTNGNFPSSAAYSLGESAIDTLGRSLLSMTANGNTLTYNVLNGTGGTSTYIVTKEVINMYTNFGSFGSRNADCPNTWVGNYTCPVTVIQSIQLPDGTKYSFGYDSGTTQGHYGQLTSMTLPTGVQVTYVYGNFVDSTYSPTTGVHITRGVSSRTTPDGTWTYAPLVTTQCTATLKQYCKQQLTVTKPAYNGRNDNVVYKFSLNGGAWPIEVDYYNGAVASGNLLATFTQSFNFSYACGRYDACAQSQAANVTKLSATTTLPVPSGTSVNQTTQFCYDPFTGNLKDKWEWNFYTGAVLADPNLVTCTLNATTTPDRTTNTTYQTFPSPGQDILNRPAIVTVTDKNSIIVSQTVNSYDDWSLAPAPAAIHHDARYDATWVVRGNLTQSKRWLNTTGGFLTTTNHYDILGNLIQTTDPMGNSTSFDYTDNFYGVSPSPPTNAYVTKTTKPVTNGFNHIERAQYYFGSGLPSAKCGENFAPASTCAYGLSVPQSDYLSYSYDSLFNRPLTTNAGDGGQTSWSYGLSPSSVTSTTKIDGSHNLVSTTLFDGLGRKSQAQTSSGQGTVYTDITYDSNGRLRTVSNPHFSTSSSTDGIATYTSYDGLDRALVVTDQDGSTLTTSYAGNCKTATDEALKARKACYDGFGRMTGVWEDPGSSPHLNYETDYTYNALDNLLSVAQSGSRQRAFTYDSLSRLVCAANPEIQIVTCPNPDTGSYTAGTIRYAYDANGNLTTKTAPKPNQTSASVSVVTTNQYDALNRLTLKTYSDGTTPQAQYTWDANPPGGPIPNTNNIGRLAYSWSPNYTGSKYDYDPMGRVAHSLDCTDALCNWNSDFSYAYDLLGNLTSYKNQMAQWTNPPVNSITFNQSFDSAGRVTQLTSSWVDTQHPATLITTDASIGYFPHGALRKAALGNGLTLTNVYNNRLQPCLIDVNQTNATLQTCNDNTPVGNILLFWMGYNAGTADNGNAINWNASGYNSFVRSYGYDPLNRISTLSQTSGNATGCSSVFGLSWIYDAWGNRTDQNVTAGTCNSFHSGVGTNNQLVSPYTYDAAGNMTFDGSHNYTYDAENRLTAVSGSTTANYAYDPSGRRVSKTTGGTTTSYVYDQAGNVVFDTQGSSWITTYLYFAGRLQAEYKNGLTLFIHGDHLGSTHLVTYMNQSAYDNLDYLPFGEQIAGGTGTTHKFTGKERDSESGLDNFGARYNSSQYGRWMSPDRMNVTDDRLMNPSNTLNKYVYGANNPLRFVDPDGRDIVALYEPPDLLAGSAGHFMLFANDPTTGESGMMSFGEVDSSFSGKLLTATGTPMSATTSFELPQSADDLRAGFAALSIQTTPEQAQDVLNYIKNFPMSGADYKLLSKNCTTVCRDALKAIGLIPKKNSNITPKGLWKTVFNRYSKNNFENRFSKFFGSVPSATGIDYGNPRFGTDTFDTIIYELTFRRCSDTWDPATNTLTACGG
jgi:RHS repeat-associated protein